MRFIMCSTDTSIIVDGASNIVRSLREKIS